MKRNYIIAVDENGQPFIAHTYAYGAGVIGKRHKYIQKVRLPNWKYRYFYSQKEYEAYRNLQKRHREIKGQMDEILETQKHLSTKYNRSKKSEKDRLKYATKYGELEDRWRQLRNDNIRVNAELEKYEK